MKEATKEVLVELELRGSFERDHLTFTGYQDG